MVIFNPEVYFFFPFHLEGIASNGKKRETFFEGNSSASDLPTATVWEMVPPGDPLLERGTKWGVGGLCSGWSLTRGHAHLQLRCLLKTFFFSKE